MTTRTTRTRAPRTLALLVAAALGAAGAVAGALPATAATTTALPTAEGSLTVHKFARPDADGVTNDGGKKIDAAASWQPLGGVEFTVRQITTVELTEDAGWKAAAEHAKSPVAIPPEALGAPIVQRTSTEAADFGQAVFASLPIGAYLVTETAFANAVRSDGSPAQVSISAAPFVVTVPTPLGDGTWNSDVHVYPKNSLSPVSMTSGEPTSRVLGGIVTWTIDVRVPRAPNGQSIDRFTVTDTLPTGLELLDEDPTVRLVPGDGSSQALEARSTLDTDANAVAIEIAPDGLTALAQHPGELVQIEIRTRATAVGAHTNTAVVRINDEAQLSALRPSSTTYWRAATLFAHANEDRNAHLAGAAFTVHESLDDAASGARPLALPGSDGQPRTTFTTGDDGSVDLTGLYSGRAHDDSRTYWLREVQTPGGYVPLAGPIELTMVAADADDVTVTVPYVQQRALTLPMTGGVGTTALVTAGAALIVAAFIAAFVLGRRRRRDDVEA